MTIKFLCGQCQKKIGVPDHLRGRAGRCPRCGAEVVAPDTTIDPPRGERRTQKGGAGFGNRCEEPPLSASPGSNVRVEDLRQTSLDAGLISDEPTLADVRGRSRAW